MFLSIQSFIESRRGEKSALYERYVNPVAVRSSQLFGTNIDYVKGKGAYLWDSAANRYLDCDAGSGVFNLGRNHPGIREILLSLLNLDPANMVHRDTPLLSALLAEALARHSPGNLDKAIFTVSGSETTEVALKIARRLTGRPRLLYLQGGYHGGTYGAMSVTDADFAREGYGPMLPACTRIPRDDLDRLKQELSRSDVAGLICEPIQGLDVRPLNKDYLLGAQQLCHEHNAMFIIDEVFVGFGRTGKFFACEHFGLHPDMLILSKALGGGYVPVGALMVRSKLHNRLFNRMGSFVHGSTFEHNDLGMAAGLATVHTLEEGEFIVNAARMGELLNKGLLELKQRYDMVENVRVCGLLVGIELKAPRKLKLGISGKQLEKRGLLGHMMMMQLLGKHRILTTAVGKNNVLRLTPPLVITQEDVAYILNSIEAVLKETYRFPDGISRFLLGRLLKMARRG
jgi:acetylornithine/succinyldiaminopimelate/putrescine aminotransferase